MPSALLCGLPKIWRWRGHGQMHSLPHCIPLFLYAQGHTAPAATCKGKLLARPAPPPPSLPPASPLTPTKPLFHPPPFRFPIDAHSPRPPECAKSTSLSLDLPPPPPPPGKIFPGTNHLHMVFIRLQCVSCHACCAEYSLTGCSVALLLMFSLLCMLTAAASTFALMMLDLKRSNTHTSYAHVSLLTLIRCLQCSDSAIFMYLGI